MKKYLAYLFVVAACGDSTHNITPDAPATVDATPDAKPCDVAGYPQPIKRLSVDLGAQFDLMLDGVGDRCDQIIRALTDPDPTKRPPELAMLDVVGVTGTCTFDDVLQRDIVRLRAPQYGGLPLYGNIVQDVLVHVGHPMANVIGMPATVVYLHGDFLPAGAMTNMACLASGDVAASTPGRPMTYAKFNACTYQGDGSYTIAGDDVIEVADEGYMVDADGNLRRVRAVDVYLLPAHANPEVTNSDAFCCSDATLDHCIGQRLLIDVVTGELVGETQHCHTC
jgi:hypothetical protein